MNVHALDRIRRLVEIAGDQEDEFAFNRLVDYCTEQARAETMYTASQEMLAQCLELVGEASAVSSQLLHAN